MLLVGFGGLLGAIVLFFGATFVRRPPAMPREQFLATLDEFIAGRGDVEEWEAFCDTRVTEPDLLAAQRALSCIDDQYPPEKPGVLCNAEGIAFLRRYRRELERPTA